MSKQKTFDTVVKHLREQDRQCVNGQYCLYRHDDMSCAAGCLIPDAKYNPDMEHTTCDVGMVASVLKECGHNIAFVRELQAIHDNHNIRQWESEFEKLATRHKLHYW